MLGKLIVLALLVSTANLQSDNSSDLQCLLPWHHYNADSQECECYNNPNTHGIVRCSEHSVDMLLGYCMTIDNDGTHVGSCLNDYPVINYPNITDAVYIQLPPNKSELNTHMCDPLNRQGRVCGECMEGYGPAIHQAGFKCSKCEWYGVPVYLLLEFVPITLFYILMLVFRISLTSAPMISFVVYCQLVTNVIAYNASIAKAFIQHLSSAQSVVFHTAATLGGIWNLDFLRFVTFIPPICVSNTLNNSHIVLLSYVSAIYPQILIAITYICITLHNRNFKPMVYLWRPFHRIIVKLKTSFDSTKSIVDVFTTFIVLSYSKLVLVSLVSLAYTDIQTETGNHSQHTRVLTFDTTVHFLSIEHFPIAAFALFVFLMFGLTPPIILCLYPTGIVTRCLRKCKLNRVMILQKYLVDKFQEDYSDGKKALAGMYMVIASASYFVFLLEQVSAYLSWFSTAMWLVVVAMFILTVQPHKQRYMNTISAILIVLPALYCILFVMYVYNLARVPGLALAVPVWIMTLVFSAPQVTFIAFVIYKPLKKTEKFQNLCTQLKTLWLRRRDCYKRRAVQERNLDDDIADRINNPGDYNPEALGKLASVDEDYPTEPQTRQTTY